MKYYRTPTGYCYKQYANGKCVRVSDSEYSQNGGAVTKSPAKLSPKDQKCADLAQDIITNNKKIWIGKDGKKDLAKFKHVGALVALSFEEARKKYPECAAFYDSGKKAKDAAKAERKVSRKKKRRSRRKSKSKKRSPAKK